MPRLCSFRMEEAPASALQPQGTLVIVFQYQTIHRLHIALVHVQVAQGDANGATVPARRITLELVGHDRPGIIHSIATRLADHGVSIDKMKTHIASGAMSGEQMFHLDAQLTIPADLDTDTLQSGLESLANELMVDITLASNGPAAAH